MLVIFFWKNINFWDFKKDYAFRFSKQFENKKNKKTANAKLEKLFSFLTIAQLLNQSFLNIFVQFVFLTSNACQWMRANVSAVKRHFVKNNIRYCI